MSKKTKQEKIIADLRRQLSLTKTIPQEVAQKTIITETEIKPTVFLQTKMTATFAPNESLPLIKRDLVKTLVLSILAIFFELVLYFLLKAGRI